MNVVVLLSWAAVLHHNHTLTPSSKREQERKYDGRGSRVEMRTGRSLNNYCRGQNRLSVGR